MPAEPTKLFEKILPSEEEEEDEVVDVRLAIAENCKNMRCRAEVEDYEGCVKRIEGDDSGEKNCAAWSWDMRTCIDHCVCISI